MAKRNSMSKTILTVVFSVISVVYVIPVFMVIMNFNGLSSSKIKPGMKIKIPKK